jgi:DNA-binding NtrC family response regulator
VKPRIVVVDDEVRMAEAMAAALEHGGYECAAYASGETALAAVLEQGADAVVTDWRMSGMDGLELLRRLRAGRTTVPVVLVTAYGDIPSAVQAMREGAFDYVTKPFDNDELRGVVARALELTRLRRENQELRRHLAGRDGWDVVAESDAMQAVLQLVDRAAPSHATVLIMGESGTGKELVARRVHVGGARPGGPFVAVNCRAFADTVLESELFGHEKGSFTGAVTAHAGCFERANGGTLLLDEIGEVGPGFQAKLLRVLQEGEVQRVGAGRPRRIDVRLIAATNRDLQAEVAGGRFREDLFFRLNVIPVVVPPLRERRADVLPLARHFLERYAAESGRQLGLSRGAQECLLAHDWPGNVRELRNAIERAVVLARHDEVQPDDLLLGGPRRAASALDQVGTLQSGLEAAAAQRIRAALEAAEGRRTEAAALLGIDRTTLFRWMKRLGLGD